jgi:hypothetical protein
VDAMTLIKLAALAYGAHAISKRQNAKALKAEADAAAVASGNNVGTAPMAPAAGEGSNAAAAATVAKVDGSPSLAGATVKTAGNTIPLEASTGEIDAALSDQLPFVPQPFGGMKFLGKTPGQLAAEGFVYGYATGDIVGVSGRILPDGEYGWIQSLPSGGLDVYQVPGGGKSSR